MFIKKLFVVFLLTGLCFLSFGKIRIVDEDGLFPDYPTISAAVTASDKGDTILITKKNAGHWQEDVTVDRGLTIVTNDMTTLIYSAITISTADSVILDSLNITGSITYDDVAGNGALFINDVLLSSSITYNAKGDSGLLQITNSEVGAISTGSVTGNGNIIRVISSNTSGITSVANYHLDLYNSHAFSVSFYDGNIIGNKITDRITIQAGNNKIKVIGNEIGERLYSNVLTQDIDIFNNKFTYTFQDYNGPNSGLINLSGNFAAKLTVAYNFFNGYIFFDHTSYKAPIVRVYAATDQATILVNHNAADSPESGKYFGFFATVNTAAYFSAQYNYVDATPNCNNYSEQYCMSGMDDGDDPIVSINYVNNGNPDPYFNDADGSRADIGCEGGAYPYSSYSRDGRIADASLRRPKTMYIEAPRKIRPGQTISIKATGITY